MIYWEVAQKRPFQKFNHQILFTILLSYVFKLKSKSTLFTPLRISALIWLWKNVRRPQVCVQWKFHTAQRKCNPCCDWLHPVCGQHSDIQASSQASLPWQMNKKTVNIGKIENNPNYQFNSLPNSFDHNLWRQPSALIKILFSNFLGRAFSGGKASILDVIYFK